jgi:hypothetical protein
MGQVNGTMRQTRLARHASRQCGDRNMKSCNRESRSGDRQCSGQARAAEV